MSDSLDRPGGADSPAGFFTVPTRVYLSTAQRERLMRLVQQHGVDVPELLSELLISFLDHLPEPEQDALLQPETDDHVAARAEEREAEIRARRAEIRRLRARAATGGETTPPWLQSYIADLEGEVQRLLQEREGS